MIELTKDDAYHALREKFPDAIQLVENWCAETLLTAPLPMPVTTRVEPMKDHRQHEGFALCVQFPNRYAAQYINASYDESAFGSAMKLFLFAVRHALRASGVERRLTF